LNLQKSDIIAQISFYEIFISIRTQVYGSAKSSIICQKLLELQLFKVTTPEKWENKSQVLTKIFITFEYKDSNLYHCAHHELGE